MSCAQIDCRCAGGITLVWITPRSWPAGLKAASPMACSTGSDISNAAVESSIQYNSKRACCFAAISILRQHRAVP